MGDPVTTSALIGLGGSAISGIGSGLAGGKPQGGVLQMQPNKWSNPLQDIGFGTNAMVMSALGNPMFANYLNTNSGGAGQDFKNAFGNSLQGMGMTQGPQGGNNFGYTSSSEPNPLTQTSYNLSPDNTGPVGTQIVPPNARTPFARGPGSAANTPRNKFGF